VNVNRGGWTVVTAEWVAKHTRDFLLRTAAEREAATFMCTGCGAGMHSLKRIWGLVPKFQVCCRECGTVRTIRGDTSANRVLWAVADRNVRRRRTPQEIRGEK
jgi:hypothetical protein